MQAKRQSQRNVLITGWCEHRETRPCVFERIMESFMVIEFALRLEEAAGICLEGRGGGARKLLDRESSAVTKGNRVQGI